MIYLVNAGCRHAGPKILSDLLMRVSDCCIDLHCGLGFPRLGVGIQSLEPGVPSRYESYSEEYPQSL